MAQYSLSLWTPFSSAWENRSLIFRLARREIEARYRGSILGVVWAILVPLLLVCVYTFVFSRVFQIRWMPNEGQGGFALLVFSGLILFNLFSECANRAPGLLLEHVTYIKKVVFPLEILPWVSMVVALFQAAISFLVLLVFYLVVHGFPPLTVLLLPVVLCPLVFLTLGVVWFISSVGIFLRDIRPFMGVVTTMMMFLSPIFYPVDAVPEAYRLLIHLNPLTLVLESSKEVLFWGKIPHWHYWIFYMGLCLASSWLGYAWFQKTRKGFADVV
ncbi:MAG: ABC transporter permease [Nitrospirales bacterium]|nr:ABC transporter permease [Nitrospirales bacterium]